MEASKNFTPTEGLAIAASIEELLGSRQGERTDKSETKLVESDPQVGEGPTGAKNITPLPIDSKRD
jgi:hypothetical protein